MNCEYAVLCRDSIGGRLLLAHPFHAHTVEEAYQIAQDTIRKVQGDQKTLLVKGVIYKQISEIDGFDLDIEARTATASKTA